MSAHHQRLFSIVTLCLVGSLGLAGCDAASSPDVAPELRDAVLHEPSVGSCLSDTSVTLLHDDGTVDVSSELGAGLAEYARPNDIVEVAFTASNECLGAYGPRLTLAVSTQSVISEGQGYGLLWDVDTAKFAGGGGTLAVRLPKCASRIDLAFGEPLAELAVGADYAAEGRSIVTAEAGKASCDDVPALAVRWFEVKQSGDDAEFAWELDTDAKVELTVELDIDADGKADFVDSQCPECGDVDFVHGQCPECFDGGEERPELFVSDGVRRVWAAASVLQ